MLINIVYCYIYFEHDIDGSITLVRLYLTSLSLPGKHAVTSVDESARRLDILCNILCNDGLFEIFITSRKIFLWTDDTLSNSLDKIEIEYVKHLPSK